MFFQNRRIRPAVWTVEFGNYRWLVFNADLIDAVLIAVQGKEPAVDLESLRLNGIQNDFRGEGIVGMRGRGDRWRLRLHRAQNVVSYRVFMDCRWYQFSSSSQRMRLTRPVARTRSPALA